MEMCVCKLILDRNVMKTVQSLKQVTTDMYDMGVFNTCH